LGGITAALFLQALRISSKMFRRSRLPRPIAMSAVGLILGIVIVRFPDVVGNGRESIAHLFDSDWTILLILILLGLRLLLTSLTVGSGAVGGVFTPTLFLGAALGDAVGSIFHGLFPAVAAVPKAYALVGMGALLAGTTHAPLMAVLMIFEMTLDYNLVLPLLLASAVASLVAKGISSESVYTEALSRKRGEIPLEFGAIAAMRVHDLIRSDQATVPPNLPLPQVLEEFIAARRNHLYVVDAEGVYLGAIRIRDLSRTLREQRDPQTVLAVDLADRDFQTAVPAESLDRVLERFWMEESERLPVLEDRESGRLIGTISQRDILEIYSLEALHRRSSMARFDSRGGRAPTVVELPADHQIDDMPLPPSLVGMTLAESRFRERYDLAVLLIRRKSLDGNEFRIIPEGKTKFLTGDRLIVFGSLEKLAALEKE
jgi:chloride channel protein, CIC family